MVVKGGLADKQVYHNVVNTNSSSTIHGRNRTSYRGISNDFFS